MTWLLAFACYIALSALNAFVLRRRFALCQRVNDVNWQFWANLDAMLAYALFALLFLFGRYPRCPRLGETISSITGRAMAEGRVWAIWVARGIDALFWLLAGQRDHCWKTFLRWQEPLAT